MLGDASRFGPLCSAHFVPHQSTHAEVTLVAALFVTNGVSVSLAPAR